MITVYVFMEFSGSENLDIMFFYQFEVYLGLSCWSYWSNLKWLPPLSKRSSGSSKRKRASMITIYIVTGFSRSENLIMMLLVSITGLLGAVMLAILAK